MLQGKRHASSDSTTTLYIRNMVCNRCIRVVKEELTNIGLNVDTVVLGEATVRSSKTSIDLNQIRSVFEQNGFELIENKNVRLIEQLKTAVLALVRRDHEEEPLRETYSEYLSKKLDTDYHYLSNLFSSIENLTIEKYIILQKIERAKELLKYGELTLSEIAYKMGYSSVQHLSNQFKKVTGLTPSHFRKLKEHTRRPIDKLTL